MAAWKDKHVVIAMLMAPALALLAYFGIGAILGEDPQPAEAGQNYPLAEKPNCRYASGTCGLKNAEFELTLTFARLNGGRILLRLASAHPLEGVLIAVADDGGEEQIPVAMRPAGENGLAWSLDMAHPDAETQRLHLVASAAGVHYFGDISTAFTQGDTTGGQGG